MKWLPNSFFDFLKIHCGNCCRQTGLIFFQLDPSQMNFKLVKFDRNNHNDINGNNSPVRSSIRKTQLGSQSIFDYNNAEVDSMRMFDLFIVYKHGTQLRILDNTPRVAWLCLRACKQFDLEDKVQKEIIGLTYRGLFVWFASARFYQWPIIHLLSFYH